MRTVIILAVACIIGATAGALTYLASHSVPQALLASGTAAGGSAQLLSQIVGTAPERPTSSQDNNRDDDQSDGIRQKRA
jgi:hypothetical protein